MNTSTIVMKFKDFTLHPFQLDACDDVYIPFFKQASRRDKMCGASPTGTGKTIMQLYTKDKFKDMWIVTPKHEIIVGILTKLGNNIQYKSAAYIEKLAFSNHIITPIKLRNMLMKGEDIKIKHVIYDEGHHFNAETYQELDLLLGQPPSMVHTASPYRGTARQTKIFRDTWGYPKWAISYIDAAIQGFINIPLCLTVPLVNDDIISIKNGEFEVQQVETEYRSRIEGVINILKQYYCKHGRTLSYDKPTMITLPGRDILTYTLQICQKYKIPVEGITADTPKEERQKIFNKVVTKQAALLHINVVSEGIDLPIRRLIDCSPMMSPVEWIQQIGRIMRPSDEFAEYICTNRNIQRHAYLLEGCLPMETLVQAQQAFPPMERIGARVMGLENIGRFQPIELPLASGLMGHIYCVAASENNQIVNYAAVIHPAVAEPIWAKQTKVKKEFDTTTNRWKIDYGDWERLSNPPDDLTGFKSLPCSPITDRQKAWWKRSAKYFGLNREAQVTQKNFQALPILSGLKLRLC